MFYGKTSYKHTLIRTRGGGAKLPDPQVIEYGEIAVNYADGSETLAIKNTGDEIAEFKSHEFYGPVLSGINETISDIITPYNINLTNLLSAQDSESISTAIGGIDNLNATVTKNQVIFGTLANGTVAVGIRVLGNKTTLTYFVDSLVGLTVNEVIITNTSGTLSKTVSTHEVLTENLVVNSLESDETTLPLSAAQGKVLNEKILNSSDVYVIDMTKLRNEATSDEIDEAIGGWDNFVAAVESHKVVCGIDYLGDLPEMEGSSDEIQCIILSCVYAKNTTISPSWFYHDRIEFVGVLPENQPTIRVGGGTPYSPFSFSTNIVSGIVIKTVDSSLFPAGTLFSDVESYLLKCDAVTVNTGEIISSVSQTNGVVSVSKRELTSDDIPTLPQSKVEDLTDTLAGKQDTLVFNTPYDASTNKAATMQDVETQGVGRPYYVDGVKKGEIFNDYDDPDYGCKASGEDSHAEGNSTEASGESSHAEGYGTTASGVYSHAEGRNTLASGQSSHAEGHITKASGDRSHAEGYGTEASGVGSHAEGIGATASGVYSHAEGDYTEATGDYSHAEGNATTASGVYSHAEGRNTLASGQSSHAEGYVTEASGVHSHAEGYYTEATGDYSHAEGYLNKSNIVGGFYTLHSVGIGMTGYRRNAHEILNNGDHYIYGLGGYYGTNPESAQTLQEVVNSKQSKLTAGTGLEITGNVINVTLDTTVFFVAAQLPASPTAEQKKKICLIPAVSSSVNNEYTEYVWVVDDTHPGGYWEEFGTYKSEVDLTDYLKSADAASTYQTKEDTSLSTTSKTLVGAINEIAQYVGLSENGDADIKDLIREVVKEYLSGALNQISLTESGSTLNVGFSDDAVFGETDGEY